MLCLKKRRTYSFTQGACADLPRRSKDPNRYDESLRAAVTTLPRKNRSREERPSRMVLTVTEDTPADMLTGSMELLVQLPREHHSHTQRVTVQRSTPMMDLLVQIATAHKLAASSYTLQAIGERGLVLPHQPNTPIGALDALQVKLLPKQGTFAPRKTRQANQPFETTFRLQVHLPRNQLYVSRVSPKANLGDILDEVCREKNLDRSKYELRHPANLEEILDLSLSLQDYHLQELAVYAKQGSRTLSSALSSQDIMALQRQEERRRQQTKQQSVFGFIFKKSKESSLSSDSLGGRSASPARSDETGRSASPLVPPARPLRKRRPAPKPPVSAVPPPESNNNNTSGGEAKDKIVISHSRNSSDSSGYHEASVLSDHPDSAGRLPETLPRRNRVPGAGSSFGPRKLAHTSQTSKSLSNIAAATETSLGHGISNSSLSSAGLRKKRAAPPPPVARPLSSAISTLALERIVDSEESLTSDMDPSKPPSDIGAPSKASSDIEHRSKASSDISESVDQPGRVDSRENGTEVEASGTRDAADPPIVESARLTSKRAVGENAPLPKPRKAKFVSSSEPSSPLVPAARTAPPKPPPRVVGMSYPSVEVNPRAPITHANDAPNSSPDDKDPNETKLEETKFEDRSVTENINENADRSPKEIELDRPVDEPERIERSSEKSNESAAKIESEVVKPKRKEIVYTRANTEPANLRRSCSIISTIPKCDHLDKPSVVTRKIPPASENREESVGGELSVSRDERVIDCARVDDLANAPKRGKIVRSQSELNDFEENTFKRQKRHPTSHAEDIACALNLSVVSDSTCRDDGVKDANGDSSRNESVVSGAQKGTSKTDVLLQKVSDTLSCSVTCLSPINSNDRPVATEVKQIAQRSGETSIADERKSDVKESEKEANARNNSPNMTIGSQQDTSDYVSAVGDDLSITDWEYQLPAPPSAFRDAGSPTYDGYDTVTLKSVEAFKESAAPNKVENEAKVTRESKVESSVDVKSVKEESSGAHVVVRDTKKEPRSVAQKSLDAYAPDVSSELKKDVISELESKLEAGQLTVAKDSDYRRTVVIDSLSTPRVAPVNSTLSNFTITTYAKPKSLDIFNEAEEERRSGIGDKTNERVLNTFATLARGKNAADCLNSRNSEGECNKNLMKEVNSKVEESVGKAQTVDIDNCNNRVISIQRSKSNITSLSHSKMNGDVQNHHVKHEVTARVLSNGVGMSKSTSITNLNGEVSKNEKFSQWRDNILKRQEEPTKEKQLQSIQVLKSILPQLKNSQQREEDAPKNYSSEIRKESESPTEPSEPNAVPKMEPKSNEEVVRMRTTVKEQTDKQKRYTYAGPPTISFGSWAERPCVNVQIKSDTDYRFGIKNNNASGTKTIVNVNNAKDDVDCVSSVNNVSKIPDKETSKIDFAKLRRTESTSEDKRDSYELTKKLITHTTATGFKKPAVSMYTPKNDNKPIVTGVALKVNSVDQIDMQRSNEQKNEVDTTPMNFKELTRAFGQEVSHRMRPNRVHNNRHSDYYGNQSELINKIAEFDVKRNGRINAEQENTSESQPKKFTSVIGIQSSTQNLKDSVSTVRINPAIEKSNVYTHNGGSNGISVHISQNSISKPSMNFQPPKPPTMPVITGVTLKSSSSRPKSMPVPVDSRNMLLESIRNFGGRDKLKSTVRY